MHLRKHLSVVLAAVLLMAGCTTATRNQTPLELLDQTPARVSSIAPGLPDAWRQATAAMLTESKIAARSGAGYAQLAPPAAGPTKEKLYASAWTAALLAQSGEAPAPAQVAKLDPWLSQLVKERFALGGGFPPLHNLFLYHQLCTSLGKPLDRAAALETLLSLRRPDGLFGWDTAGDSAIDATSVAVELLLALGAAPETLAPTRAAVASRLKAGAWLAPADAQAAIVSESGPLLLTARRLGLPPHPETAAFVARWSGEVLAKAGADPFSVDLLLTLIDLHALAGTRLALPDRLVQALESLRLPGGGYALQGGQSADPQFTFKVQKLLQAAGRAPRPDAARAAAGRFRGDSWETGGPLGPNPTDTYYGLALARYLNLAAPVEPDLARYLQDRLTQVTAGDPEDAGLRTAAEESYFILAARSLLEQPFPLPATVIPWVERNLTRALKGNPDESLQTVSRLAGAAGLLKLQVEPGPATEFLLRTNRPEKGEAVIAYRVAQTVRGLGLDANKLAAAKPVAAALRLTADGGAYRSASDAPAPDLYTTYRMAEVLRTFAPDRARAEAAAMAEYARSTLAPAGGATPAPGLTPTLRSTAEALTLLGQQ